jgi:hypothetical protein
MLRSQTATQGRPPRFFKAAFRKSSHEFASVHKVERLDLKTLERVGVNALHPHLHKKQLVRLQFYLKML